MSMLLSTERVRSKMKRSYRELSLETQKSRRVMGPDVSSVQWCYWSKNKVPLTYEVWLRSDVMKW